MKTQTLPPVAVYGQLQLMKNYALDAHIRAIESGNHQTQEQTLTDLESAWNARGIAFRNWMRELDELIHHTT